MTRSRPRWALSAATVAVTVLGSLTLSQVGASAAGPTSAHVDFEPANTTVPAGYTADTGKAFNGTSGWMDSTGTPQDFTTNTRARNSSLSPDARYDTLILMQADASSSSGNRAVGWWQTPLANGDYNVTVGVGDATATNSVNEIIAQPGTAGAVTLVDHFAPTSTTLFATATKRVTVSNGTLTLAPTGGTNTKLDYVDAVPVSTTIDTTPPNASIALAGTLASGTTYSGPVTVTVTATDDVGVTSTTYSVDGAAAVPYTAPFIVSSSAAHTINVTAKDAAGNTGTATRSFTIAAASGATSAHVDFEPASSAVPAGYTADTGKAFNGTSGWRDPAGTIQDFTANTRVRNSSLSPDARYDTLILMQADSSSSSGNRAVGWWQTSLANGDYNVTVGVGDATATNSVNEIIAQPGTAGAVTIIDHFAPTSTNLFATATKRVTVSNGTLILAPTGGTNTKLDYVDIVPAPASDTTPPNASISLAGSLTSPATYAGPVTVTVTATDNVGVTSTKYSLDGATPVTYTAPFVVSALGAHTINVSAQDAAGNVGSATSSFTVTPPPDTTPPVPTIALAGTLVGSVYNSDVTVTLAATDDVGVVGPLTYTLDGGSPQTYATPLDVSGLGDHTVTVSAQDAAGNTGTATKTFTIAAPDTTAPSASIDLAGTTTDGTNYTGSVTVTINSSDDVAVTGVTYTVDGGSPHAYSAPFTVSATGNHTIVATASDAAGNTGSATSTFTIADTTPPVPTVNLSGPLSSGTTYTSTVTVSIAATDDVGVTGISYSLDGGSPQTYSSAFTVSAPGGHTVVATASDAAGNTGTATSTFTIAADTTAPTVSVALAGTSSGVNSFNSDVTVTVAAADESGGSGLASVTYSLDGASPQAYPSGGFVVTADGTHTVNATATDNQGNVASTSSTWTETHPGPPHLVISGGDNTLLLLANPRLVFSNIQGLATKPPKSFTFTNTGTGPLVVTGLAITGSQASSFSLASGQPTSFTVPAGGSTTVAVVFTPTAPTGCPANGTALPIGDAVRAASLTWTDNDPATGNQADLSGTNSCAPEGNFEPVLDQVVAALGYSTVVDGPGIDRRYIGPLRYLPGTDELSIPYFTAADSSKPVSLVPVAHFSGRFTGAGGYGRTGWFSQGATVANPCNSACHQLFSFASDTNVAYVSNQMLLPPPIGTTTFNPGGVFGIYQGDGSDVNYSDDSLDRAQDVNYHLITPAHYLHTVRIFGLYGPGHVRIPNAYLIGVDITREPGFKNNDFQDLVFVLSNAAPAISPAATPGTTLTNLTAGGTVSPSCAVTGFDGVLANSNNTQCNAANIAYGANGLTLTSTSGALSNGLQQNALYRLFDGTRGQFSVKARITSPISQLSANGQQLGTWFGPDRQNAVEAVVENTGDAAGPHISMKYRENGVTTTVASVAVPALSTATTVDVMVRANANVPDPIPSASDTNGVRGYPLTSVLVFYAINGGAFVQVGTTQAPANVTGWFSTQAKGGIFVSNGAAATPISAVFSQFGITAP